MPKLKKDKKPARWPLTPNQIVALRLEEARDEKRWTQLETVTRLRKAGLRMSRVSYAMAVGAPATGRPVRFDADQLVAFARAFDKPVGWFFQPPHDWQHRPVDVRLPAGKVLDVQETQRIAGVWARDDPANEEERQRMEQLALRVIPEILRFLYERGLLPRPEPMTNLPPEVQADVEKAIARELDKHRIAFRVQDAPHPSRAQMDMLASSLTEAVKG